MQRTPLAAAVLLVLAAAPAARAGDNPLIKQGIQEYDDLMYEESVNTLSAALMRSGNTSEQLIEIYKYLGLDYMLLDKPDEADGAFRNLLCIDEEWTFDPNTTSPKIVTFFNAVKQRWIEEGKPGKAKVAAKPVTIVHKVPDKGVRNEALNIQFSVKDPDLRVAKVTLHVKVKDGFIPYPAMPTATPGIETVYMVTIPGDLVVPSSVDYYIEATDAAGNAIASRGDADAPLRVTVPGEEKTSVAKKWWFWTIIGVAAAGIAGGIAGGVVAANKRTQDGGPASVTITICEHGLDCP